jgi:hypothetical protein
LALISSFAVWLQRSSTRSEIGRFIGDSKGFAGGGGFLVGSVVGLVGFKECFLRAVEGFEGPEDCAISSK